MADQKIQWQYKDLFATVASKHSLTWNDEGSGARTDDAFWLPSKQGFSNVRGMELRPLGSIATNHHGDLNNNA